MSEHTYHSHLVWDGNHGNGTSTWESYGREYHVAIEGKPDLAGSSNRMFRGDPAKHDPEDLFLAAVVSCHMLAYLALCAQNGIRVVSYEDRAVGTLVLNPGGGGRFTEVILHPVVTIEAGDAAHARELHETAHQRCFIANSCSVPIRHEAAIRAVAAA